MLIPEGPITRAWAKKIKEAMWGFVQANSILICKRPIFKMGLKEEEPTLVYLIQANEVASIRDDDFLIEEGLESQF